MDKQKRQYGLKEGTGQPEDTKDLEQDVDQGQREIFTEVPQATVKPFSTITIIETLQHIATGRPPTTVDNRGSRTLITNQQPYVRWLDLNNTWIKLDIGWVQNPGIIVLENKGGPTRQVVPTPEEKKLDNSLMIELGIVWPIVSTEKNRDMHSPPKVQESNLPLPKLYIPPKDSQRLQLVKPTEWYMRSPNGPVRCCLTVFGS